MRSSLTTLLAATGLVQLASAAACKPRFCRNAILGAADNSGIDDCNAFLLTTVILPVSTAYSTPTAAVTKTHNRVISETETDSYTSDYQPTSVIWSTYTSVDTINSVTLTTKKLVTTTTSPLTTKTTTTALHTTTSTTTTMTTTRRFGKKRDEGGDENPLAQTITQSVIPEYASACSDVDAYTSNCLALGATATVTTISPVESLILSSTLTSTASADSSVYVSTTITQTTTKTLPSLHSTKTVESTTIIVTSTDTSTEVTATSTITSYGIKVSTLVTTTTTTTLATASPTPYTFKVYSGNSNLNGNYLDYVTKAKQPVLTNSNFPGDYAIGFAGASSANVFVFTPKGLAVIVPSGSGSNTVNTPYYLTVDSNGNVIPNSAPASDATIITCQLSTIFGTTYLSSCNLYLTSKKITVAGSSLTILTASNSNSGSLTISVSTSSY
ncbi:hypothetical protein SBRCBS47491_003904 [Sporothrix bragantina]|uniref:Uncharacterized protein n=1 Tax=Sporothrix bragantina TaxID=671064 RepID=A0ABP0BIZ1_9PEZI